MLARVANNLFWMGRYIERAEHVARFMSVNYFSSLDAPNELSQSRQFVLRSMLHMIGEPCEDSDLTLDEQRVLYDIAMNEDKAYSISNCIKVARENASTARDLISTELFESLNKFYHFITNYDASLFKTKGLYDFTTHVIESTAVLRGKIRGTLLHDEIYAIIMMGINLERATQIARIIHTKYKDALVATGSYKDKVDKSYEWSTLLKCAESYDMMRRFYKKVPTGTTSLEFLILNPNCPRSIMNSLNQIHNHIQVLKSPKNEDPRNSLVFLIKKIKAAYEYTLIEEVESNLEAFIEEIPIKLWELGHRMENEYFNYQTFV